MAPLLAESESQNLVFPAIQVAVRALAFKWIRILHRCWQNRTPYDESKYLEALRRKGSPLLKYLAEPV